MARPNPFVVCEKVCCLRRNFTFSAPHVRHTPPSPALSVVPLARRRLNIVFDSTTVSTQSFSDRDGVHVGLDQHDTRYPRCVRDFVRARCRDLLDTLSLCAVLSETDAAVTDVLMNQSRQRPNFSYHLYPSNRTNDRLFREDESSPLVTLASLDLDASHTLCPTRPLPFPAKEFTTSVVLPADYSLRTRASARPRGLEFVTLLEFIASPLCIAVFPSVVNMGPLSHQRW